MKFLSQLKLLLWKNFTLRKRHTTRNIIEILWPLVLFFILVAVRSRRQPSAIPNKYYRPRAMPSAGMIPFIQSFLCDFRGEGLNYSDVIQSDLPNLQGSSFARFLEDAFPLIQNSTLRDRVLRLSQDYQKYVGDERQWMDLLNQYQNANNITNLLLSNVLKDSAGFQEFLINQTGFSPQVAQQLLNAKLNMQQVDQIVQVLSIPNIGAGGIGMLAGLASILRNMGGSQLQMINWVVNNYQLVQRILQGQNLTAGDVRRFVCDDSSPVAIDKLIQLNQGNMTEVKSAICSLDNAKLLNLANELRKQIRVPGMSNTTAGPNLLELQRRLTKDLQDLSQDEMAVRSFERVLSDYMELARIMQSSGGNFNDVICSGRWSRGTSSYNSSGWQQSLQSGLSVGRAAATARNYTQVSCLTNVRRYYPDYLKQLDNNTAGKSLDQCALIYPPARVDCGWPGMKPSDCVEMGCCFDSSVKHAHYCFYPPRKAECGCLIGLATRRASGVTGNTQRAAFDRGFVQLAQLFLKGEILYTPDNPTTRDIINKVKSELSDLGLIEQFAGWWVNNSDAIRQNVMNASQIYQNVMELSRNLSETVNATVRQNLMNLTRLINVPGLGSFERLADMSSMLSPLANGNNSRMNLSLLFDSIDEIFRDVVSIYKCIQHEYFVGYSDEDSLVRRAVNTSQTPVIASLVFENLNDDEVPKHIKYKIRQDIDFTPRTDRIRGWYWRPGPRDGFGSNSYLNFGFVFLQDLIERALSSAILNETIFEPGIYLQPFPYPCYISDRFVWYISGPMPLLMTLAWIYSVAMIIKGIVYEKERRLTEVMKVMGLGRTVHWCAWFINSSIIMLITIFLLVITMKFGNILQNSNPLIVIIFLVVFMISTIMMCFLISVFFSRANVAAACGGIIFFVTYLPYSLVRWYEAFMTTSQKAFACLSSTTAFGLACTYFARYEEQGVGVQWSNFYSSPIEGDGFSLGYALTMMMVDAVLYGILTWYIEAVRPGQYGIPKPWYFPFLKSYWFPDNLRSGQQSSHDSSTSTHYQSGRSGSVGFDRNTASGMDEVHIQNEELNNEDVAVESEPSHLPLGVSIQGLVKIYKEGNKLAVDGLNLNLYEGQITSFLGHNGAGKTTTMSILTGLYSPTSGTAMISGKDIRSDMDVIRKSLGMCPQYNVLFDQLTVEEHLWFYSSLKGMTKSNIPAEIEKFLKDIGLEHKRHELAANLSGGMKRKLSVAMAFIAGSKVVILDEPTAGVDPYARRGIWDLLLKYKEGRTILLSTHHMDEADVLGDRVAIISQGKLQCCGSSLFLKGHYGNGYYLTLTKRTPGERPSTAGTLRDVKLKLEDLTETNSSSTDEGVFLDSLDAGSERDSLGSSNSDSLPLNNTDVYCSENTVSSFIKNHIPTAQLVEHVGSELTYVLPTEAAKEGKFQDMFDDLDKNLGRLHVGSYGVSDTTLEEVFLKVAEDAIDEEADKFAAEVPKRRFSFRHHLFSKSRVRDRLSDKCDLLDCMEEENVDKEMDSPTDTVDGEEGSFDIDRKSTGLKLILRQFWALVVKRFHHSRRNRKGFASQIILPAIFVCLAMIVAQIRPFYEMPPIELSTKMFQDSEPYKHYLMFSKDDLKDQLAKNLSETFLNYPGVGTACMDGSCPKGPINFEGAMTPPSNSSPDCSCASGIPVCPAGAGGPTPRHWKSYSGDILQNMTGRNVADHLLKTYHDYVKKRYGVVTFGDNLRNLPDNIRLAQDPATKRLATAQNTKAWYNNKGYHAMPTFLNVLSNNILRDRAKDKGYDPTQFGISVTNHPMNYTKEQLNDQTIVKRAVDVLVAICVVFALSFVPASFVVFLVNERASKGKHLHLVSGVRPYVYWIANYFWDMCNYLIPAMLCVLIFLAFNDESYTSAMNFPPTLCLLLLYGWAITPLMYPASYLFTVSSTAYIVLICLNLFIGVNCTLATFILELFQDDQELTDINDVLKVIFLVFPNYCLGRGLIDLAKNQFLGIFDRFGQNLVRPAFSWDITGRNILAMIIQGFLFFFINVLIEYRFFYKPKPIINANTQLAEEDDDVKRERQRVVNGAGSCTDAMRLVNLTKVYKVRKKTNVAVNQLCVGVSKGECFGLLGVNGAGKTTTFKMLTGDIHVTSGEAYVNGYSVLSDIHSAHQTMGYCPQFDALDDLLTAKEHLYLYSRLRGVPEDQIEKVVKNLIHKMNLTQYQDVCAGKYSGGNKRKLSTAIALVGNPAIVFMDEPTTGMDPKARRFLWNIITGIVKEGRTVILTSHSMEECEALCNRVAIMVNGQFKCLGSPQHLKNKYGDGYTVVLKVAGPNPQTEQVSEFIKTVFPNAILKDQHLNMLEYQLPSQGLSVSKLFGHLEANRKIFDIEDYSVSQTTLDQVFINFAKDQTDGMDELQVTRHPRHNMELRTMRYTHLIEGDEPGLTVDV